MPDANPRILAVGLNPVQQKSLLFPRFTPEQVNRADAMHLTPGGKGIHFALACNRLNPGSATVAHFLGGESGHWVGERLDALDVPQIRVDIAAATRGCTTVLCRATGHMTELIEPSPQIQPAEADAMRRELLATLASGVSGLALCGTFPPGVSPDLYAELARAKGSATLLLDGYRGVEAVLATGAVDILKINLDELRALTGETDPLIAGRACLERFQLRGLAITDGPKPARYFSADGTWTLELPPLHDIVNPIGAGDTTGAVMLTRLLAGYDAVDAFAWGLAAASASCLHIAGGVFDLDEAERRHAATRIHFS